jgi:acyl-CoA dehydrogenase
MIASPEREMFRQLCRKFTETEIIPHAHEWEEAGIFPRALYKKAAQVGILGAGYPEEYGGSGGDRLFSLTAAEELLWGGSTGVVVGLLSLGIALPSILLLGTEAQKQRWVPPILAGDKIAALGVTEPGAGSDVSGVQTTAVRDGDHYVLNGSKLFITSGVRADTVVILARTSPEKHGGLTFFVVERGTSGFGQSRALQKTGWWASDTAELSLADVRVPVDHRLGEEGSGFSTVMQTFVGERLFLSFLGHQTAHIVLQDALAYARDRKIFGRNLSQFQLTRHKLAKMQTRVEVARRFNYSLARQVDAGESPIAEVAMAKNFSSEVAMEVTYEAVQLLGGMGYMRETRVERLSRDARLLPIGGGTSEIMNEIIAKTALNI